MLSSENIPTNTISQHTNFHKYTEINSLCINEININVNIEYVMRNTVNENEPVESSRTYKYFNFTMVLNVISFPWFLTQFDLCTVSYIVN